MFWLTLQWKTEKKVECIVIGRGHMKASFFVFKHRLFCGNLWFTALRHSHTYVYHTEHHHSNYYYHNLCEFTSIDTQTNPLWNNVNEALLFATFSPVHFHVELFQFKVNGIPFSTIQLREHSFCCWLTLFYFDNGKCAFDCWSLPWLYKRFSSVHLNGSFSFTHYTLPSRVLLICCPFILGSQQKC